MNSTVSHLEDRFAHITMSAPVTHQKSLSIEPDGLTAVAFFAGLGSRSAYRDVGLTTIQAESSAAAEVYEEAAEALGQVPDPRSLATDSTSLPEDPIERQGYIGAAFLTHNLAIYRDLQRQAGHTGALHFSAYTGESFGMLAAAVAGGSLTVPDGVLLAYAFPPILLAASNQRSRRESAVDIDAYVPRYPADSLPVAEPAHVIALRGEAEELAGLMRTLDQILGTAVELHKRYSPRQLNVYVTKAPIPAFVRVLRSYPEATAEELKEPTTFLAHSRKMTGAREAFDRFIDAHGIVFSAPHTPLISNSGGGFLLTGDQVRNAVPAMTNEIMDSQHTTELIDELQPDIVTEIGRGMKSLQLLRDNAVRTGTMSISNGREGHDLVRMATLARQLHETIRKVDDRKNGSLDTADVAVLRDLTVLAAREPAFDGYLRKTAHALAFDSIRHPEKDISPTSTRFREALQYTLAHRDRVKPGVLVLSARLRKRLVGDLPEVGRAYLVEETERRRTATTAPAFSPQGGPGLGPSTATSGRLIGISRWIVVEVEARVDAYRRQSSARRRTRQSRRSPQGSSSPHAFADSAVASGASGALPSRTGYRRSRRVWSLRQPDHRKGRTRTVDDLIIHAHFGT